MSRPHAHQPEMEGGVILHGVAPDSGNLGLNALCTSLVNGLREAAPGVPIGVLGYADGIQTMGDDPGLVRLGAYHTRRFHRPESLWNIRVCARLGGLGNPVARRIHDARAFLDASGGDSFTDLYGMRRFWSMVRPKQIALENNVPLVFLPQTYGPFESRRAGRIAAGLVRDAHAAWARDHRSFDSMRELLGGAFDPDRHRVGVDMAFALEPCMPSEESIGGSVMEMLGDRGGPIAGLNVSGLIYDDPMQARERFGFRADYNETIVRVATGILREADSRLLLVPHVIATGGGPDCDARACEDMRTRLTDEFGDRVVSLPRGLDERETKWAIGQCDWFCGTRMHSTIAALGSGVACAAIAYSKKTLGVFETCGLGDQVVDPRSLGTDDVVARVLESFTSRSFVGARLAQHLPSVKNEARAQIVEIARQAGLVEAIEASSVQAA